MNIYCVRPRGSNIGNEVIYLGVKHFLKGYNVIRIDGLTASTVYEINQYGDGVIVGGGNIYENNGMELDLNALKALQPPLFLFSLSHGRVYDRDGKLVRRTDCMPDEKIIALHDKALISSVRDFASKEYLESIGCGAIMCGCPSQFVDRFNLALPEAESLNLIFVRNPELMNISPRSRLDTTSVIRQYIERDTVLACNDKRDIPFAASFGIRYIYFDDVYSYLATIKAAKRIVSYRLHATLPAKAFDIPVSSLNYDERSESLMKTLSEDNYYIMENMFRQFLAEVNGDNSRVCSELFEHSRS